MLPHRFFELGSAMLRSKFAPLSIVCFEVWISSDFISRFDASLGCQKIFIDSEFRCSHFVPL